MKVDDHRSEASLTRPTGTIRIGAGAGFAGDRLDPAVDLATRGQLDVLVFEILAERTIALAQRRQRTRSGPGYDNRLEERMAAILPEASRQGTMVITNGGAADARGGRLAVLKVAKEQGEMGRGPRSEGRRSSRELDRVNELHAVAG